MCAAVVAAPLDPFSQEEQAALRRAATDIPQVCEAGVAPKAVEGARKLRKAFLAHPDTKIPLRGAGQIATPRDLVTVERARLGQLRASSGLECRTAVAAVLRELPA
jgi:hypothetical protein